MATLSHIAVHPVKALDPLALNRVAFSAAGGLTNDRAYAIVDSDGTYVNGKRTAAVHPLRAEFGSETATLALRIDDRVTDDELPGRSVDPRNFRLPEDRVALESWLSAYFGTEIELRTGDGGSQTDGVVYGDSSKAGPTLVAEATLDELASWYGLTAEEMRLRMRPNLVVSGVPPFWEDRLVDGQRVRIGKTVLEGEKILPRCVVPKRHPKTGEKRPDFQQTFVEHRKATLPDWTITDRFDGNYFRLTARLRVPESERDGELRVGDAVELLD